MYDRVYHLWSSKIVPRVQVLHLLQNDRIPRDVPVVDSKAKRDISQPTSLHGNVPDGSKNTYILGYILRGYRR